MTEVKELLDPLLRVFIGQITKLLDKKGIDLVVVGGESINAYFEEKPIFRTHDYDLRIVDKDVEAMYLRVSDPQFLKVYKNLEKQRDLTFEYLKRMLNRSIANTQIVERLESMGIELVPHNDENESESPSETYFFEDESPQRLKFRRSIVYLFKRDDELLQETILDYVVYTSAHFTQFLKFVKFANQPIPYVEIDELKYATIPFIVWDTIRVMRSTEEQDDPKYPRFRQKYLELLRALENVEIRCHGFGRYLDSKCGDLAEHTDSIVRTSFKNDALEDTLSCSALSKLAEKCVGIVGCNIDGRSFSLSELVELGTDMGLWPDSAEWKDRIEKVFDETSLCKTVKRFM